MKVKLVYPKERFDLILQNTEISETYYALDEIEMNKLKVIQAKYGCNKNFQTLPDSISLNLFTFFWNEECQCFEIDVDKKVSVQLNLLEESVEEYAENQTFF